MAFSLNTSHEAATRQGLTQLAFDYFSYNTDVYETVQALQSEGGPIRLILAIHQFDALASNRRFTEKVLNAPLTYLSACEEALRRLVDSLQYQQKGKGGAALATSSSEAAPHLGIKGWLGSHTVTPRGLSSRLANKLVCVVGIVTRCSLVHPKLSRSVLVAEETLSTVTRQHRDAVSLAPDAELAENLAVPREDAAGNRLEMEVGLSEYADSQRLTLQEMPESAPTGQLPRSAEVFVEADLVDRVKPGDRVRLWGLYRCVAVRGGGGGGGLGGGGGPGGGSASFVVANNVEHVRSAPLAELTPADLRLIREIAARADAFDVLAAAVAPTLCGHELVKKGLLLQQLGGERKGGGAEMRLRGDIHVLLIGDPSCGKSQLLRFMMKLAPLALSTTGRGSTGVGLTAAVSSDRDTGERRLEAGAMVLGDGGLVCIDEFDKMTVEDRVAIHEVLEQQTISINKAGIQTVLNARASVLAAANPVYGCFDPEMNLKTQIAFPDSLLTRFDLIYIVRDAHSLEQDRKIASQVLQQLARGGGAAAGDGGAAAGAAGAGGAGGLSDQLSVAAAAAGCVLQPLASAAADDADPAARQWITHYEASAADGRPRARTVLSSDFLRRFIQYARNGRRAPVLGRAAVERLAEFYANLRQLCAGAGGGGGGRGRAPHVIPTARTLEACVRLATAHAKLKLKTEVDAEDALEAQKLVLFTLLGEPPEGYSVHGTRLPGPTAAPGAAKAAARGAARKALAAGGGVCGAAAGAAGRSGSAGGGPLRALPDPSGTRKRTRGIVDSPAGPRGGKRRAMRDDDEEGGEASGDEAPETAFSQKELKSLTRLIAAQRKAGVDFLPLAALRAAVLAAEPRLAPDRFDAGVRKLQETNKLMVVAGDVWFV